jgi:hypothetical protein
LTVGEPTLRHANPARQALANQFYWRFVVSGPPLVAIAAKSRRRFALAGQILIEPPRALEESNFDGNPGKCGGFVTGGALAL